MFFKDCCSKLVIDKDFGTAEAVISTLWEEIFIHRPGLSRNTLEILPPVSSMVLLSDSMCFFLSSNSQIRFSRNLIFSS